MSTGGFMTEGAPPWSAQFSPAELEAVVAETHPDFDPAVVDEIAAAGIYVCPTMNVHALTLRDRFGDALDKVIMGLYSGGAQIIAVRGDPRSDLSVLRHIELV